MLHFCSMNKKNILWVSLLIGATVIYRLLSNEMHWYHLVPIAAMGIFSGAILKGNTWAYLIPLLAMLVTDVCFELFTSTPGFYHPAQIIKYLALVPIAFMGTKVNARSSAHILLYTLGGTLLFFIISNFGTWAEGFIYPRTFDGLVNCFTMALPFYKSEIATSLFVNAFVSDIIFSAIAFTLYNVVFDKVFFSQKARA